MNNPRSCGCKGCRTCLLCEEKYGMVNSSNIGLNDTSYVYCPHCNRAWKGWTVVNDENIHPKHEGPSLAFSGVYIKLNFLSEEEEDKLIRDIDAVPWDLSQSGRRKQNYGPKCNFKKQKLRLGNFRGFPKCTEFVQDKFKSIPVLENFQTIEQCSLEYDPIRGASIDPHIDDCWVWGERIVTVNLLSDSVLTMTPNCNLLKYNLNCVSTYPTVLNTDGLISRTNKCYDLENNCDKERLIRIPMPRRSLLVMYGSARYDWEHQVLREDVDQRRICIAYREFTPTYLKHGNKYSEGQTILDRAKEFY